MRERVTDSLTADSGLLSRELTTVVRWATRPNSRVASNHHTVVSSFSSWSVFPP